MDIRDAVEADAERLAALTGAPTDVMRNLVHDRTVRVAERDGEVVGFVSFDARETTVHVTQLEGETPDLHRRLLEEPTRFADGEGMDVELLVPDHDESTQEAAVGTGFSEYGPGPRFDGTDTTRYRWEPDR
jgi:hypothetical protein